MGVCKSKQVKTETKIEEKLTQQPSLRKNTASRSSIQQLGKSRLSLPSNMNIKIDKDTQRYSIASPSLKPKTPQIINQVKQPLFEFQTGFFKKYSTLHTQKSEQVLIYQHNLTGQLARVTILSAQDEKDINYLNKLRTYQQKCLNICQIIEIYKEKENIYVVQEYCKGGSLHNFIKEEHLTFQQASLIMQQMIVALNHVHNQNLSHCHLTVDSFSISDPKNLFVKLSDINPLFTTNYLDTITSNSLKHDISLYQSPEKGIDSSRDVWSLGVIFHELLADQRPEIEITHHHHHHQDEMTVNVQINIERTDVPEDVKKLIKQMLNTIPNNRITLSKIIQSGMFSQKVNSSSLQQCIVNLGKVKKMTYFQNIILYYMMTQFHHEEIQILTQLFDEADKDSDDQLDKNELINLYSVIIENDPDFVKNQIDQIFLYMDSDNSGFISLNEFITAAANKDDLLNEDYLEVCFKQLQNPKGGISIKSLGRKIDIDENQLKVEFQDLTYDFIYYSQFKELMQQLI